MDTEVLKRALGREKSRRLHAEMQLESRSRELYESYEKLRESHEELAHTNKILQEKQQQFIDKQEQFLQLNSLHDSVTSDLRLAANLQQQILPDAKRYGDYEVRGLSKPAMYVAGDIYDYFRLTDSVMAFYMADVTGHGPAAAMISYSIHKQLNPRSSGVCISNYRSTNCIGNAVCKTVASLNDEYASLKGDSHYFTIVYGLMDFESGEIYFAQAGHPAPMHYSKGKGQVTEIGDGGFPVGMFKNMDYTSYECTLDRGDSFYLYSDGITECYSPANEEYGRSRLIGVIEGSVNSTLTDALQSVDDSISNWNSSTVFSDDVSILAIKRH